MYIYLSLETFGLLKFVIDSLYCNPHDFGAISRHLTRSATLCYDTYTDDAKWYFDTFIHIRPIYTVKSGTYLQKTKIGCVNNLFKTNNNSWPLCREKHAVMYIIETQSCQIRKFTLLFI